MSIKKHLGLITMASVVLGGDYLREYARNRITPKDIDINRGRPIPNGCKRYFFNRNGECEEGEHDVFFDGLKKENAYKKFKKWLETHP